MMRKFLVRPSLVDERTKQKQLANHQNKLRQATHAIDCLSPPTYSHLTLKLKKLQLEHERVWQIENENRRLLSRLAEIMNHERSSCKARFNVYNTKRFRGGVKIRPASQPRIVASSQQGHSNRHIQKEGKDQNWQQQRTAGPHRPHTVAVMARDKMQTENTNCELLAPHDTLQVTKRSKTPSLCGCASRQPLALPEVEALPDVNVPLAKPQSPLNDVSDLLFGIQSVEITMKPQLTD